MTSPREVHPLKETSWTLAHQNNICDCCSAIAAPPTLTWFPIPLQEFENGSPMTLTRHPNTIGPLDTEANPTKYI